MKEFMRQALWLAVPIVPIPAGAFAVHSPEAILIGALCFSVLVLLVPFFYFLIQKNGFGTEFGAARAGIHLVMGLSLLLLLWGFLWFSVGAEERFWTAAGPVAGTAAAAVVLLVFHSLLLAADYGAAGLYRRLSAQNRKLRAWLALVFLTGLVPGVAIGGMLFLALTGLDQGMMFVFYVSTGLSWILFLKIALAMMAIPLYLFSTESGSPWKRSLQVIFTAFFWFICLYIPLVISLRLPVYGAWRAYADPSYLSIVPFLSDLWLMGIAYFGGKTVTEWIFARGE